MLILSGCSREASRLHTTAATTTAVGPVGQAVANQNAEVIPTASAERIPVRTAGTGSDQSPQAMFGPGNSSPRSKAAMHSRSRARASARSRSSAARTSADTIGPSSADDSFVREIPLPSDGLFPGTAANRRDGSRLLPPWRKAPPRPGSTCAAAGREHAPRRSRNTPNAAWPGRRDKPWRARSARRRHARGRHRGRAGRVAKPSARRVRARTSSTSFGESSRTRIKRLTSAAQMIPSAISVKRATTKG